MRPHSSRSAKAGTAFTQKELPGRGLAEWVVEARSKQRLWNPCMLYWLLQAENSWYKTS